MKILDNIVLVIMVTGAAFWWLYVIRQLIGEVRSDIRYWRLYQRK